MTVCTVLCKRGFISFRMWLVGFGFHRCFEGTVFFQNVGQNWFSKSRPILKGIAMETSNFTLKKWLYAIFLSISVMTLCCGRLIHWCFTFGPHECTINGMLYHNLTYVVMSESIWDVSFWHTTILNLYRSIIFLYHYWATGSSIHKHQCRQHNKI